VGASGRGHAFQDGWFYPGDLATFAQDGSFVLIGRTTEVANIGGVKVDPTLVDEAARSVPGVKEAALIIVEGPTGFEAILAVVCDDDETALAALDAARASSYGMRLETVWRVPSLPRTEQGKVQRADLADRWKAEHWASKPGDRLRRGAAIDAHLWSARRTSVHTRLNRPHRSAEHPSGQRAR
jgi:acyl-coenzyme A synthetase/AMP-(fatty) acid ligase